MSKATTRPFRAATIRSCPLRGSLRTGASFGSRRERAIRTKLQLLDGYYDSKGFVKEDGEVQGSAVVYISLLNNARLTAGRLAEHLARQGARGEDLQGYIEANYARSDE